MLGCKLPTLSVNAIDLPNQMYRQADQPPLVDQRPFDTLPNPPRSIGRKPKAALRIKFIQCMHQPEIAFFNQIQQRQSTVHIAPSN